MRYVTESIILSVLTGIGTWVISRKRNRAEVKKIDLENIELINTALTKKSEILDTQIVELLEVVKQLREENLSLKNTIYDLQTEIVTLKAVVNAKHSSNTIIDNKP